MQVNDCGANWLTHARSSTIALAPASTPIQRILTKPMTTKERLITTAARSQTIGLPPP